MTNILIVEDEADVRDNIEDILVSHNYNCLTATNGEEALEVLSQNKISLIISDIMMPKMDGMALYKKIVEEEKYWSVPFVFLSAKSDETSIREGMKLGAEDYIKKPFRVSDVLDVVNIRLKKSRLENKRIDKLRDNISKYIPHELRTPLGIILGYSNLILEDIETIDKAEIFSMVKLIEKSGLRLQDRIEKLILLTELELELESGLKYRNCTRVDSKLVENILIPSVDYYKRNNDLKVNLSSNTLSIPSNYFERLLRELVDNACKFSTIGTHIEVIGRANDDHYNLSITDEGIGMDADEINQISSFKQFSRELRQQEGNGLGLIICERLCQLLNIDLQISSKKGIGSKFNLKIKISE